MEFIRKKKKIIDKTNLRSKYRIEKNINLATSFKDFQ